MGGALRILQTGEFRLDEPLLTGTQLPESLKNIALEARYLSTVRVINAAISEKVDVLIIAGNAFDWSEDRRPAWFLTEQFNRLDRAGIQVIWSELHDSAFPAAVPVPSNVHQVTPHARSVVHSAGRIVEFCWDWKSPPTETAQPVDVRITFHRTDVTGGQAIQEVTYTSQKHASHRVPVTSIQGGSSSEPGPHGVQLIAWNGTFENNFLVTDTVRWVSESLEIRPQTTRETIQSEIKLRQQRFQSNRDSQTQRLTLCHWRFTGEGPLWDELITSEINSFGSSLMQSDSQVHHFWSIDLDLVPDANQLTKWHDHDAVAIGFDELNRHYASLANLIPETYQKPAWATQFKTASIKKSVIPQLVRGLRANTLS